MLLEHPLSEGPVLVGGSRGQSDGRAPRVLEHGMGSGVRKGEKLGEPLTSAGRRHDVLGWYRTRSVITPRFSSSFRVQSLAHSVRAVAQADIEAFSWVPRCVRSVSL